MAKTTANLEQNLWLKNFIGWHRALLENDYTFDILNSRIIDENGLPSELKILFAPMQIFMRKRLKDYIERWIDDGGIFVSGPWFGMYDEKTYANKKVPPVDWFGIQQNNLYYIKAPVVELLGELRSIQHFQGEHFIEALPISVIDRSSWDYWTFLRKINWRVSPSPVRVLTQICEDPLDVWGWNRTQIIHELNQHGYSDIADNYQAFYQEGWQLFLSQWQNTEIYRNIILNGYNVLKGSIDAINRLK